MSSKLTRIADSPNPDGSHGRYNRSHIGQEIAANIPVQRVQELIAKFQARIFEKQMQNPAIAVNRIEVAHKEAICETDGFNYPNWRRSRDE
jgi:hypothetical protein